MHINQLPRTEQLHSPEQMQTVLQVGTAEGAKWTSWDPEVQARAESQDYLVADPDLGLFIVADGVGGEKDGGNASSAAAISFLFNYRMLREGGNSVEDSVPIALAFANAKIAAEKRSGFTDSSAATTFSGLCVDPETGKGMLVQIGDSFIQRVDQNGDPVLMAPLHENDRGALTNVLDGAQRDKHADYIKPVTLRPGERWVLHSDGLEAGMQSNYRRLGIAGHNNPAQEVSTRIRQALALDDPQQAARALYGTVATATDADRGPYQADDNAIIVIDYGRKAAPTEKPAEKPDQPKVRSTEIAVGGRALIPTVETASLAAPAAPAAAQKHGSRLENRGSVFGGIRHNVPGQPQKPVMWSDLGRRR